MTVDAEDLDADTEQPMAEEAETPDEGAGADEGAEVEPEDDDKEEEQPAADALVVNLADDGEEEDDSDLPASDDPKASAAWKALKAERKQLLREVVELRAKAPAPAAPKIEKPGERPALKDFDGDENLLADALVKWAKANDAFEAEQAAIKAKSDSLAAAYRAKIEKLGRSDYKQQQDIVSAALTHEQQVILLQKTKETAALVYGLGKDPAKLRRLAAINDPLDFHVALLDIERTMKINDKRKPPNPPESVVRGNSGGAVLKDRTLERLEKQADETGNRAPVQAYLREKSQKKK
jgi:hypothetical protein